MFPKLGKFLFFSNKPPRPTGQDEQAPDAAHFRKLGNRYLDEGRLDEAEDAYRHAIAIDPQDANAHANLGMVLVEKKRSGDAAAALKTALALDGSLATPHYLLGQIAQQSGSWAEAAGHFRLAVAHGLDFRIACRDLCHALMQSGRTDEARGVLEKNIAAAPDVADYHLCLGNLHAHDAAFEKAIACFDRALAIEPQSVETHFNLGRACQQLGRFDAAFASFGKAIALDPDFADAYNGMGALYNEQRRLDDAIASFQKALERAPGHALALKNLCVVHTGQSNLPEAVACQERFLAQHPAASDAAEIRWALAVNRMRLLAESDADPAELTARCLDELDALSDWCDRHEVDGAAVVGSTQLFFLAYQRDMNWREVLVRYGTLCSRLMKTWYDKQAFCIAPQAKPQKIRLGIVCAELFDHSVWNAFLKGWYDSFDRDRFEIRTFSLGTTSDGETRHARKNSDAFIELGGKDLQTCVRAIALHQPAILLYPAIGMDGITLKLASLRLAQTQIAAWGHPETSGLPTMDYFISAQDFEPDHAGQHYSERLARLPGLGCSYAPLTVEDDAAEVDALNIPADVPVLLCPGAPVKYTREHDAVFVDIAQRLGRCRFVFFTTRPSGHSDKLRQRLEQAFSAAGMVFADYCFFTPWLSRPAFYALMRRATVFLDTIGFSGFNTAIQAVECGLPIVAFDGKFMRGRLAAGILRRAGLTELIARTDREYVEFAVALAHDADHASRIRQKMKACTAPLFHDPEPARAINDFLGSLAGDGIAP